MKTGAWAVDRVTDRMVNRVVALDTSVRSTGVALIESGQVVAETWIGPGHSSAASLLPALDGLLDVAGWSRDSVDAVGVVVGPGSFTGLRIGVTTAKALAYTWQVPVIGVTGLEALAMQAVQVAAAWQMATGAMAGGTARATAGATGQSKARQASDEGAGNDNENSGEPQAVLIVPVIPSRRGECYLQVFALPMVFASPAQLAPPPDYPQPLGEPQVVSHDEWAAGGWLNFGSWQQSEPLPVILAGAASLTGELVRRW
ncbi:MAG: tRNA (adenosine(37)-N6)-threonylcarbamoyltransferase complex dimerization subunit type 1 TsaB, partial [Bacteroidota bacterium]